VLVRAPELVRALERERAPVLEQEQALGLA